MGFNLVFKRIHQLRVNPVNIFILPLSKMLLCISFFKEDSGMLVGCVNKSIIIILCSLGCWSFRKEKILSSFLSWNVFVHCSTFGTKTEDQCFFRLKHTKFQWIAKPQRSKQIGKKLTYDDYLQIRWRDSILRIQNHTLNLLFSCLLMFNIIFK